MTKNIQIGFLVFPDITQLDLTGPAQVLSRLPGATIHLVWKNLEPVPTDAGFSLLPTTTIDACPSLNVLCVPGGSGNRPLMKDADILTFLKSQGATADYVTSVCSGSLLLGAAGLLQGYRAACHWAFRSYLPAFGAEPVAQRVVRDRNRITGGGVTAGIDFALTLVAEIAGEDVARQIQLHLEYDPAPPFDSGSPERATPALVAKVRSELGLGDQRINN